VIYFWDEKGGVVLRKIFIWGSVVIGCLILTYAIWVLVAMNRKATISVDYIALLNETSATVPENDRAWPLYRDAGIALRKNPEPSSFSEDMYDDMDAPTWPDQAGWEYYKTWIDSHKQTLDTIHRAAAMDGMGYVLCGTIAEEDKELWPDQYASQKDLDQSDEFFFSVLTPQFGPMRAMARFLSIDAKNAAFNGDAKRCLSDIEMMLAIGTHVREHPLLISDLISFSIYKIAFLTLHEIMEHDSSLFSLEQLDEFARILQGLEKNLTIRFDGERLFFLNFLQRVYTDNGNGDGSIIPNEFANMISQLEITSSFESSSLVLSLVAPIADMHFASRKEMLVELNRRFAFFEKQQLEAHSETANDNQFIGLPWASATSVMDPFYIIDILLEPSYNSAIEQGVKTRKSRDALLGKIIRLQGVE
jgi:hypothetical protein